MTQVAQRNNHVLLVLKRLKDTLDNDKKKYADKVNILVMTWERIAASAKEQRPLAAICIVEKMYKDTLNVMLQGEWPKMSPVSKTHLMQMLNRCRTDLCKEMPWLNSKFRKLLELVNDPWTLPSLERILHKDPCPATPEQIIEFCESERGLLIVTRLTMLCSSRCEKVAIKLAEACFGALTGGSKVLMNLFTTNEYNFIFDIYLCLLFKYKKLECIINALKTVSIADGYYLVIRLRKRNDLHEQKIWKFSHQVAAVASRYFITVSMLSRTVPNSFHLKSLISDWLSMCKENNIENEIRKVMQPAETSEHIYIMAEVLTSISQQLGNQIYSSLIIELYIRALTADINYLENVKLQNDKERMTNYEKHLASKFLALADLVKDHSGVRREFVLTAFSIHPSPENYKRVEEEAIASGKASPHSICQESLEVGVLSEGLSSISSEEPEGKETTTEFSVNNDSQDSGAFVEISNRCPLHIPYDGINSEGTLCFQCGDFTGTQNVQNPTHQLQKKKERSLDALILIKGNTVTESLNYDVLSAPSQVLEAEKLGLSSQVCADLVTLLGSNRYHLLTWVLEWGELSSRCLRYMNEADTIKNGKKELKFLEIDYNQYKDWPENDDDEADCIEKGYEQWLEDDDESELDTDSKRSNTDDSEELMLKTALKRSQKQIGRYAESSSDSEDSRSRPRPRKRGRPRKRLKSFSDSGSISDSLGSDGQKQNNPSKKPRKKSKDLRKTLGKLKVLEMRENANNLSSSNDCFSSELLGNKIFGLPTSASARSDPTVLKSLRAFRPNAHKNAKNDEFIQAVTENIYNSKSISGKIVSNKNTTIFDCNDNKFLSQGERFTFGGKDMELHFRAGGVRTKKYKDVIRTIKEDLISVSNIPNVANNATVNVVHIQNSNTFENASQNIQTSTAGQSMLEAPSIVARNDNLPSSVQKPKQESETQGSQSRKPISSQSLSQNDEASFTTAPSATILSSALTRNSPTSRSVVVPVSNNQFFTTTVVRPNKVGGQPQYMAIVNRNSLNQINSPSNQVQITDCQNVPTSVVGFITTNNVRNFSQNFTTQASRTSVQPGTRVVVSTLDPTKFALENERPNVILSRNYGVQNNRAGISTLYNHVTLGMNNNVNQIKRMEESNSSSAKQNTSACSESSTQNISFENTTSEETNGTKITMATSKTINVQRPPNETVTFNVTPSSSVFLNSAKSSNLRFSSESEIQHLNKNIMQFKNSVGTNVANQVPNQALPDNNSKTQTVIFQTSTTSTNKSSLLGDLTGVKRSFHLSSNPVVKIQNLNSSEGAIASQNSDTKYTSTTVSDIVASRSEIINNVSNLSPLTLDVRNISSVLNTTTSTTTTTTTNATITTNGNTNYGSSNLSTNKPYNEIVNIIQGIPLRDGAIASTLSRPLTNASTNRTKVSESGEVIAIIDSSPALKLNSTNVLPARNILATVLKRNSSGQMSLGKTSSAATQYSLSNTRNPIERRNHCEAIQNVMVSQSSSSSTIHYTVVNPLQQEIRPNSVNSSAGDIIEKIVKEEDFNSPESIKSPLISQIKSSEFTGESVSTRSVNSAEEFKVVRQQQLTEHENKKTKPVSSPLTTQGENNFLKKPVLNNQKITILVQNNEENNDKAENSQRNNLNELLFRDDQKTCITFRAIKRTQFEGNSGSKDKSKIGSQDLSDVLNNDRENLKHASVPKETGFTNQGESGSSESLCQYLVLEAINDPSGALPKFNQAFGKSYQIKVPQAIKPVDSNETSENEANYSIVEQEKIDTKTSSEPRMAPLHDHTQVPTTESSVGGNAFEIVQKPVKSVYIDKDAKLNVQKSPKNEEEILESPNISTIQMSEGEQQLGVDGHQFNTPKVVRSSVVQQLLRKVPTTGPPTLQAVNSINTLASRQVKAQDVVSGSTLIYATETRAQSQIVIQRSVGRVNGPTISQVAPVIYTQNLSDQSTPQTQTLLLAAVPSGTRGVVPGAQLVRIPSNSGVWKMTPSVNPPRIVQLRPPNLVLQGGQDQNLLMQSGQPVLLHHLTSLPVKPVGIVSSEAKTDQTPKIDVKNEVYSKPDLNMDDSKICSVPLEVDQTSAKSETSSPAAAVSEHETVSLMKDIKEFENVFEETKLKFEMEKHQGVCPQDVEGISQNKTPLSAVHQGAPVQADHQTVLVQSQLLHKPQMIITSAIPNQQAIFTQKIDKPLTLEKEPEKRLILTTKPKIGIDESTQSHVALAYVSHSAATANVQKPLVVVTNYAQPPSSPSPSINSQNSSSPNSVVSSVSFTGSSTSSCKTPSKSKSRNIKSVPNPSKSPPVAKPQQKPQEDANTAQKIYAILEEYAVQLRNSPDMNNRPAPRRRSNPPTSTNTKRKKTVCKSKDSFLDGDDTNFVVDGAEPLSISEDSSSGVTVLQVCVSSSH